MRVEADILRECADASSADLSTPLPSAESIHGYAIAQLFDASLTGPTSLPSSGLAVQSDAEDGPMWIRWEDRAPLSARRRRATTEAA